MKRLDRRIIAGAWVLPILLLLGTAPGRADKLVVFKNGKALLVQTVETQDQWLKLGFDRDNFLSVPAASVTAVEETETATARAISSSPNQLLPGERNARAASSPGDSLAAQEARAIPDRNAAADPDAAAAQREALEAERAEAAGTVARPRGFRGGQTADPTQNPLLPGGLRPFNPNAAQHQGGLPRPSQIRRGLDRGEPPPQEDSKEEDN